MSTSNLSYLPVDALVWLLQGCLERIMGRVEKSTAPYRSPLSQLSEAIVMNQDVTQVISSHRVTALHLLTKYDT